MSDQKKPSKYLELIPMTMENINNGDLLGQVNRAITRVTEDINQRPEVGKPRKITMEIVIAPPHPEDPQAVAGFGYVVKEVIPPHRAFKGQAVLRDGELQLHEFPAENPNQTTIPFAARQ